MDPQEFLDYWKLDRAELAMLVNKGVDTVNQWMAPGTTRKTPDDIRRLLGTIHLLWTRWEVEADAKAAAPVELESLFQIAIARKRISK